MALIALSEAGHRLERRAMSAPSESGMALHERDDFIRDSLERRGAERARLGYEQALVGGKELCRSRVAHQPQAAVLEIRVREFHCASVCIRLARDLAENPVTRSASASTTAGRRLDCDKSEKGNGTRTTEPAAGVPMLRPPRIGSSLQPARPHSAARSRGSPPARPPKS